MQRVYDTLALCMSRVWLAGKSPVAPGTAGSLVAMLCAPYLFLPLNGTGRCLVLAGLFVVGSLAASRAEQLLGKKDPGEVVIDEVLGQWLTYAPFSMLSWPWLLAGFLLFRCFDICKPWPVRQAEHWLPGGWGVMIDDAVAGLYGMAGLGVMYWVLG